jgi:hypothetical protein
MWREVMASGLLIMGDGRLDRRQRSVSSSVPRLPLTKSVLA